MSNQTDAKIVDVATASFFEMDEASFASKIPKEPLCLENIQAIHIVAGRTLSVWFKNNTHVNFKVKV